jgi:tRNA threonylcarbamoyl adenosine modification protein YjeE
MTDAFVLPDLAEDELGRLAQELAFVLTAGDALSLSGEIGAGKTTFARAFIRAAVCDPSIEAPSPTFTLAQAYDTPRYRITHYDFYRIADPNELDELGLDAALRDGLALIEWPERGGGKSPEFKWRLDIVESSAADRRTVTVSASGNASARLARLIEIRAFLESAGWGGGATFHYLQGDASARRYARLGERTGRKAILMDAPAAGDGPPIRDGKPYSRIAHLAEDVRAFAAVADALRQDGFAAPEIYACDLDRGLLLIEDFGDAVFGAEVLRGRDQAELWRRGVDALVELGNMTPPGRLALPGGGWHALAGLDYGVLEIESSLLLDWLYPAIYGADASADVRAAFADAWRKPFETVLNDRFGWLLRDFHSPNLIALDDRAAPKDVGLIDFQDALIGPRAYDLASLLQDARVDVPAALENALLARYIECMRDRDAAFDEAQFRTSYAILGAQRATKILGIFARLAKRDGKPRYLSHLPRIWGYLERNLAHPALAPVAAWYDAHIPATARLRPLAI